MFVCSQSPTNSWGSRRFRVDLKNAVCIAIARAAVVHLNFRAGSTFPVPVCTVLPGHWVNKADTL